MTRRSAAQTLQDRASAALERLTSQRRDDTFATGRQNKNHHEGPHMGIDAVMKGVTIGWLAQAMDMNHDQVKKKLRECPPLRAYKNGFIYDFKVAVSYLIKPRFDIEAYIKQATVNDLPPKLQKEYWGAKAARLEYEEQAGHLWRDENVLELYGEMFSMIKAEHQQWAANIEKEVGLTDKQQALLQAMVDQLQDKIHKRVLTTLGGKSGRKRKSVLEEEREREAAEAEKNASNYVEDDPEDETYEDLVASLV